MNCAGCRALSKPVVHGYCALGERTGTEKRNGMRIRHPLDGDCKSRPKTDGEYTERLEIIARERR